MGGGLKQLQAKRADRALVRGVHGGPEDWPPGGGYKGEAPPCLRKFCILQANLLCIISGPFWSRFTEIYDFGVARRQVNFAS